MKRFLSILLLLLSAFSFGVAAQDRAYEEGPVSTVTSVKILPGQFDTYTAYLRDTYKPIMDEAKKAGIILDWAVYTTDARTPSDPDMYLVVTYPNMASFDGLEDRMEPISQRVTGQNRGQGNVAYADRGKMREILGTEMVRQIKLK